MQRTILVDLIKFIKKNDLVNKYNNIYSTYDNLLSQEDTAFKLDKIFSLTDDEIKLIISSSHVTEALFRLRVHMKYGYNELMDLKVSSDFELVLHIVEDIYSKIDKDEYDKEHKLIKGVCSQNSIEALERIDMFLRDLTAQGSLSSCGLDLDMLLCSLGYTIKSKCDEGADLILSLASNSFLRKKLEIDDKGEYYSALLDVISKANHKFQVSQIESLLKAKQEKNELSYLYKFQSEEDRLNVLRMFTRTMNERAGEQLILMLEEEEQLIKTNPKLMIEKLEICRALDDEEEIVPISSIKTIDELEYALLRIIHSNMEIDKDTKVRLKRHK